MQIDFFDSNSQTTTNSKRFGICDDGDKTPAYIDYTSEDKWISNIINDIPRNLIFTAIDHGVIKNKKGVLSPKRCDGMLHYDDIIIFVELKNRNKNPAQISQLEKTIELFCFNHDINEFKTRKAYLSNKKKTVVLKQDTKEKFKEDNKGFRLYFSTDIHIL